MHVSLQLAYTIFPYFEIMFENDETAWEISDFLELEDDEIKFFRKKKIPKGVITKMEKIKAEMREEEKEEWRNKIKDGIFREIPPQDSENEEENVNFDSDIVEESSPHNATVVDIFDDFSDEELDEIASELSTDGKSKTKLRNDSKSKKEKDEEKLDKGQTTLFSF